MDSSSGSSSNENENLKEALDHSMFISTKTSNPQSKHSLRGQKSADNNYKNNILDVTPEFQNFVAKRLSKLLDGTIKECHKDIDFTVSKSSGGIRLFKESTKLLKDRKFVDPFHPHPEANISTNSKRIKRNNRQKTEEDSENEIELLANVKSVAVSPSWVLEKKGTVGWSKPKGDTFVYRRNKNNELELVEDCS